MRILNDDVRRDTEHHNSILAAGYTGCDVVVMSQHEVRMYYPMDDDEVCISIGSQKYGITAPELNNRFKEVLALQFDDIGVADRDDSSAQNISDEQAMKAVRFFDRHQKESKRIVIHCFAGLSRSRSMAGALCLCFMSPFEYTILNESVKFQILKAYAQMRKEELECLSQS